MPSIEPALVKIYSVGVWNIDDIQDVGLFYTLKFTPLEFETDVENKKTGIIDVKIYSVGVWNFLAPLFLARSRLLLKFTPLEFETPAGKKSKKWYFVKIYSVGVWNQRGRAYVYRQWAC